MHRGIISENSSCFRTSDVFIHLGHFAEMMGEERCQHQKKRVEKVLDLNVRACAWEGKHPQDITKLKRCDSTSSPSGFHTNATFLPPAEAGLLHGWEWKVTRPGRMARARAGLHYRQNAQLGGQCPSLPFAPACSFLSCPFSAPLAHTEPDGVL